VFYTLIISVLSTIFFEYLINIIFLNAKARKNNKQIILGKIKSNINA